MLFVPGLIRRKRDGGRLTGGEWESLLRAHLAGEVPDYQIAALLMAIYFRGMDRQETVDLTRAMIRSGKVLDLSQLPGIPIDKHSTGGVGDKVSLVLAPLVASCGVPIPMVSGRGLGHTGGTLDKLESIPGLRTRLREEEVLRALQRVGLAMVGPTDALAPADRSLYALRDVTATVESLPLITASILSKKVAAGIRGLVLDVKVGRGAFMKTEEEALALARSLVGVGGMLGLRIVALVTAMDEPLGRAVGNALEVAEAIAALRGDWPPDLWEVTRALGARMLFLGGKVGSVGEGARRMEEARAGGGGLEAFRRMIEEQGGDPRVVEEPDLLPQAPIQTPLRAPAAGFLAGWDARRVAEAAVLLGAGRQRAEDGVDPAVGIVLERKAGDEVREGETVAVVHAMDPARSDEALRTLASAFAIRPDPPQRAPLLIYEITGEEIRPWGGV